MIDDAPGVEPKAKDGFTLIELMVSMALGFLLLAGAFEMHAAFTRQSIHQQETADMQQALRVAAQVIGRAVRTAGTGLNGGVLDVYDANVVPNAWTLGAVQFSNSNAFPNGYPSPLYDKVPADTEANDPDWIRVISIDATPASDGLVEPKLVAVMGPDAGFPVPGPGAVAVSDVRPFPQGAFVFIYNGDFSNDTRGHRTCVRQVTNTPVPNATFGGILQLDNVSPYNPPALLDTCLSQLSINFNTFGASYAFSTDRSVIFRIEPGLDPPPPATRVPPRLRAWYSSSVKGRGIPNFYPEAQPDWQTLTENIADLQVALLMSNGVLCGALGYSTDDASESPPAPVPGPCPPRNVRAVRFTVVARSGSTVPGWAGAPSGPFEDEVATPADGYFRRALTEEIQIRNTPWGWP